jgi:hypothetical protein
MSSMKVVGFGFLCALSVGDFAAATPPIDFTIHEEYISTRALGMGNAFTAVVDDHNALFYNPAALGMRKDGQVHLFVRGGLSQNYLPLLKDIDKAKKDPDPEQAESDLIQKNYGEHFYGRAPTVGAMWVRPHWGIAFIPVDLSTDVSVHQAVGPQLNVAGYLDSTLAYGYGGRLKLKSNSEWYLGATLKAIHRVYAGAAVQAADLAKDGKVFDKKDADEGMTVDADIGTLYTPDLSSGFFKFLRYSKPTFAAVVRNIGDYGFPINYHFIDKDSQAPPHLQRRLDLGSKWQLPKFWVFDPHLAVDERNIFHSNFSPMKGFHAGVELYWTMYNWWKGHWAAGMNEGYWTAGVGARLAWFQFDLATYGEEVGTSKARRENRRFMAELSLDF